MKLTPPTEEQADSCLKDEGYVLSHVSENGTWNIGLWPVMFGIRVVAWRKDSIGRTVDYCAGADRIFTQELLVTIKTIFESFPEDISEFDVHKVMPVWKVRPISGDSCWPALQEMASKLTKSAA